MSDASHGSCTPTTDGHCSLCGDVAMPARVIAIDPTTSTAEVDDGSARSTIALDLVDDVTLGDTVMVHMGFAIEHLGRARTQ